MAAQLIRPSRVERRSIDSINERFDGDRRGISQSYKNINLNNTNLKQKDVIVFFKQAKNIIGGNFKKRRQPSIPYVAISLALSKDVLDYVQISGVGLLITVPISVIASASLIYWAWGKTSFRAWKEKILRWLIISIIIELFPLSSFIPATLILVLIIHYNEIKVIRLINLTLDYMKRGGMLDR
jgi:hypothetical protein